MIRRMTEVVCFRDIVLKGLNTKENVGGQKKEKEKRKGEQSVKAENRCRNKRINCRLLNGQKKV